MTDGRLDAAFTRSTLAELGRLGDELSAAFPGTPGRRQPVHSVYGGAHLFRADIAPRLGERALVAMDEHFAAPQAWADVLEIPVSAVAAVAERVREKLAREPVEDYRIDFEDGYGNRSDAEEDADARQAARAVAAGLAAAQLPPFLGIRIKPLSAELGGRALRTLDLFLSTLVDAAGRLPDGFAVTLPKITHARQCAVLAEALAHLEATLGLAPGAVAIELMIETTQSVFDASGLAAPAALARACAGRCRGAHFGTYDYTAACDITAAHQHMAHPSCDFAKHVMQVTLAGTGVWLSDGATNVLPVAVHRAAGGETLSVEQLAENRQAMRAAWALHARHVRSSLEQGFYQGWDLHPAQLVTRYGALYAFFLSGLDAASERLRNFVGEAAQATLVGEVFDDAATGQGLLNYFLRALACGAITEADAVERSGLSLDELRSRSFAAILRGRR